jgi:hypothetical protein
MNHFISLAKAREMTGFYRKNREAVLAPPFRGQNLLPFSETFDRAAFDRLLSQQGCSGMRIYYGINADRKIHALVVGVNAAGKDMVGSVSGTMTLAETLTAE